MADEIVGETIFALTDARSCKRWLDALPLTNVLQAHALLSSQVELLNREKMAGLERLKIVEQLREPIHYLQQELQKKLLHKSIPLRDVDLALWEAMQGLLQGMAKAYQLCLQAHLDDDMALNEFAPLITQRCLFYLTAQLIERFRVFQEPLEGFWRQLHQLFAYSELQGFARTGVKDSLNKQVKLSTCSTVYVHALLLDLANPYQMTGKQLTILNRWLEKWGSRVDVTEEYPPTPSLSIIAVDLDIDQGPKPVKNVFSFQKPRYLDMERLGSSLRKRVKFLQKGGNAEELKLGDDCIQPACQEFLSALYTHWCEAEINRATERREHHAEVQVALGMQAIYYFLSGQIFKAPTGQKDLSWKEIEDIQLFGRITERGQKKEVLAQGFNLDLWHMQDESALGFCIARNADSHAAISHFQLIALKPADSERFVLGMVRWLRFQRNGELHLGVKTLPGPPTAIAASQISMGSATNKYAPAFLLPEMPALQSPASLILPSGWFAAGRRLEVFDKSKQTVRLVELLEKGSDYERVSFA